ncbi:MAG TPA: TldD/PmbA family protein [Thermoleophilaceae bacterium]
MKDVLQELMAAAAGIVDYADARYVSSSSERLGVRNGRVLELARSDGEGFGVRVRMHGAWGFAAARGSDRAAAESALARAIAIAESQPSPGDAPALAPEEPALGSHSSPSDRDPFDVSFEDKLSVLTAAEEQLRDDPRITVSTAHYVAFQDRKAFASTEGASYDQTTTECGGGVVATAVDSGETQVRSYPASFRGDVAQRGFEHFTELDLVGHAPRVRDEALALLSAPACPSQRTTLILDGEQLALQVHESVGHAVELDRVLGLEASYAGTSWVEVTGLGSLRYGSELMNVTADATTPEGLGSFAWDDEGVAAHRVPIVRDGVLRGFLSSRETAGEVGLERSGGAMRADGFARQPIVRMTNVHLEPGDAGSLEDLIASTDRGILMETNRSWSIDQRRWQFQFGTEIAWEIVDGRRGRMLRNPSYAGVTPEFWGSLDAVCSAPEWRLWGVLNCGKGEPGQSMHVSHGTAPARFRDVQVGIA